MITVFQRQLIACFTFALVMLSTSLLSQDHYVVIGSFKIEGNAQRLVARARKSNLDASYKYDSQKKLFYVSVMKTGKKEEARNWTRYLQNETSFKDAWLRTEQNENMLNKEITEESMHNTNDLVQNTSNNTPASSKWMDTWTTISDISYIENPPVASESLEKLETVNGKMLKFVIETDDNRQVPGEVMVINPDKRAVLVSFPAGGTVALRAKTKNKMVTVVCDIFGYKEQSKTFNLDHLSRARDVEVNSEGVWEVRFKLKRLQRNDISIMYNVAFLQNAAILKPSSKNELEELLALMKSDPFYKIAIHSHCNPTGKRKVKIPSQKNCFDSLSTSTKVASAMRLTRIRGKMIRSFLMAHGIEKRRILVVPWGCREMLVSQESAEAEINNRIEIEVLEDKNGLVPSPTIAQASAKI